MVTVPYLSDGQWKFAICGCRHEASNWRQDQIELIDELTARIYLRIDLARAKSALQEVNQRLEVALMAGDVVVWDLDLVTHKAWRSLQHDLIFGYDSLLPEWSYEMFLEHVIPKEREQVDREFKAAIATQTDWDIECCIHRIALGGQDQNQSTGIGLAIVKRWSRPKAAKFNLHPKSVKVLHSHLLGANLSSDKFLDLKSCWLR
jgi:hypothetical protein